ncbi:prickle-like protein 4 isoform X2 [Phacochoerus africanus]|uniref:prickle-like protein 4 isoform X2 n=1 Tax=Phacochoerus africanus TaxID=41426 RepID=UPI001FD8F1CC|nr:prickle-like protein 4 isoform X2 [Phacochoerus africanus]
MSLLNSGWPHPGERLTPLEPNPPVNPDSNPGQRPEEDPEEASAQDPEILHLGHPDLDTSQTPSWPGLRTLLQQLPPQDSDERYCLTLEEEELAELRLFCAWRRREALGQGVARLVPPKLEECTCEKCREPLRPGEYGVFAARAGEQCCWHPACFACQACGQALINLIYFYHDGHLYCGRHHAELLRPRCPACDQLIFSRRCTEAEGRRWHENHFCCQDCAGPLGGGLYALPGGDPCCPSCFESRYSDAGSRPAGTQEGRASLGKGGEGADTSKGKGAAAWAGLRGGVLPGRDPHPGPTPSRPSSSAPVVPTAPPDPSLGARSSHRASLAGALQGPPEPTPRRGWGCGAGLAPELGPRLPSGGRRRGGAGAGRGLAAAARTAQGRGGRLGPDGNWLLAAAPPGSCRED